MKIAAEGASVGHSNLVDTTTALTSVLASGISGAQNYSQAMGALNSTVGSGEMNMQDLAEALGTGVVPVVKGYGLNLKDVGAALATYGDLNIRGAKAGTELRMAVQALAVPAAAGKTELNALGLSTNSLSKDMQSGGLLKALDDLNGKFKANGITAKNEGAVITELFGKKAGAGLALLLENMDRVHSKYPAITRDANDFNKAWQATQATPAQKWKELTAGLQASAVNFGTSLLPAFTAAAGFADRILNDINGTKGAADAIAVAFGAAVAVFTTKKLVSGVEEAFETAEKALGVLGKIGQTIGIPGADKLSGAGKGSASSTMAGAADTQAEAAKTMADAAATQAEAANKMGTAATGQETAGAEEETAGTRQETAGAEEDSALGKGGGGLGGALGTAAIGLVLSKIIIDALENPKNHKVLGNTNPSSPWNSWPTKLHHNDSIAGEVVSHWDDTGPRASATQESQFQSRFGISVPGAAKPAAAKIPEPDTSSLEAAKSKVQAEMGKINDLISQGKAAKIPAPDLSGLESAKATVQRDLDSINAELKTAMGKPAKMASPDMSALASAKATAAQDAAGIHTAAQTPLSQPVHATSPDLSAYANAKSAAAYDGASISLGLAQGILSEESTVVAAANQVASAATAAMAKATDSHSPSKVTEKIGASVAEGLVVGMEGGQSAVNAAATALGQNVAKAADITSIDNSVAKLLTYAPKGDTGLVKMLKDDGELTALANQPPAFRIRRRNGSCCAALSRRCVRSWRRRARSRRLPARRAPSPAGPA